MKYSRAILLAATLALAAGGLSSAAHAQLTVRMGDIKCEQYLAMSPEQSRNFSSWLSGWYSYQTRKTTIDLVTHQKNIAKIKDWCKFNRRETVMSGLDRATGAQ